MRMIEEGGLPVQLSASLPAEFREAFNHPVRRQIVRALDDGMKSWTSADLVRSGGIGRSISAVRYHVEVLLTAGVLKSSGRLGPGIAPLVVFSGVIDDKQIATVSQATDQTDRDLLVAPLIGPKRD
jgi:DNA-binding transcriptional ArsR family regulator